MLILFIAASPATAAALGHATEFHFVVKDLGERRATWVPGEVVIHRSTELADGLVFVLENPTNTTHAFAAYGLFEEVMGAQGSITRKPLRVNVTPEDSVRVQVSTAQFEGVDGRAEEEERYPFFCPFIKGTRTWAAQSVWCGKSPVQRQRRRDDKGARYHEAII